MKKIQVYGPFFTSYSFARVNTGLARGLKSISSNYNVTVFGDKDKIDYFPTLKELSRRPDVKDIFDLDPKKVDVVIYNNFPKNPSDLHGLKDLKGDIKLGFLAWEESVYPKEWVDEINENLHGLMVTSTFVKEVFQRSGIRIPIEVIHNAVDENIKIQPTKKYPLNTKKSFKFLHISTAKARKGVDTLIKAYFEEFKNTDDVVLVLKTSPNPNNNVDTLVSSLKNSDSPEVIHINDSTLSDEDIRNLHDSIDCEVYPSRAEGFGLPILEAMYCSKPVITTNYGGQTDFCNKENSFLLDFEITLARDSESSFIGARWAEPNIDDLKRQMRFLFENSQGIEVKNKVKLAKKTADMFTWESSAKKALIFIEYIEKVYSLKNKSLGVITPINDQSGISKYSKDLYLNIEKSFREFVYLSNKDISDQELSDDENIFRTWSTTDNSFAETLELIKEKNLKNIHIQHHPGIFPSSDVLNTFIKQLNDININIFITFHSFLSKSFDYSIDIPNLKFVKKIFIHNKQDFEHAAKKLSNVELLILPTVDYRTRDQNKLRKKLGINTEDIIVASHGLLNTNKNIEQIILAINLLKDTFKDLRFLAINAVSANNIYSSGIFEKCKKRVSELGLEDKVTFFPQFLKIEEVHLLAQVADLFVFNYTEVGESASAAIRDILPSAKPIIATDIKMFSEFDSSLVLKIRDTSPEAVAKAIETILKDKSITGKFVKNTRNFIDKHSYTKAALKTLGIIQESN